MESVETFYPIAQMTLMRFAYLAVQAFIVALTTTIILHAWDVGFVHGFGIVLLSYWLIALTFQTLISFFIRALGVWGSVLLSPFMILQIVTSSTFIDPLLLGSFYQWGYVFPWYHASRLLRHACFGTPSSSSDEVGISIGVLIIYYVAFYILAYLVWLSHIQRKLNEHSGEKTYMGRILGGLTGNRGVESGYAGPPASS